MISSFVFCIGALIQTINTHSLSAFYVARVIAGLGLGAATVVVPMFSSEMTPKDLRGQIGSLFQWFFTFVRLAFSKKPFEKRTNCSRVFSHRTGSITPSPKQSHRIYRSNGRSQLGFSLSQLLS